MPNPSLNSSANNKDKKKLSAKQVIASVLAAMFGVQSNKNRERDFSLGNPVHFIIAGIVFVICFLSLVFIFAKLATQ